MKMIIENRYLHQTGLTPDNLSKSKLGVKGEPKCFYGAVGALTKPTTHPYKASFIAIFSLIFEAKYW